MVWLFVIIFAWACFAFLAGESADHRAGIFLAPILVILAVIALGIATLGAVLAYQTWGVDFLYLIGTGAVFLVIWMAESAHRAKKERVEFESSNAEYEARRAQDKRRAEADRVYREELRTTYSRDDAETLDRW